MHLSTFPTRSAKLLPVMPDDPFAALAAPHRRAIHVHCYRMVGSVTDAEDLVQETLIRAWRARDAYDPGTGAAGYRNWLYRIATNVCLDFLKSAAHRAMTQTADVPWLQPYADRLLDELPADGATPDAAAASKETIALGYLGLIQRLPPTQRAALVLRDVLGWSAAETAEVLALSVAATNSALQRARATLASAAPDVPAAPSADERAVLAAFIDVHQRGDAAAALALMHANIRATMPPLPHAFVGRDAMAGLLARAFGPDALGEWRLVATAANRQPAAVSYLRRPGETAYRAFKIDVLHVRDGMIDAITTFDESLVGSFGLPAILPGDAP